MIKQKASTTESLLTISKYAKLKGVRRQMIYHLLKAKDPRIVVVVICGFKFVDVDKSRYVPVRAKKAARNGLKMA